MENSAAGSFSRLCCSRLTTAAEEASAVFLCNFTLLHRVDSTLRTWIRLTSASGPLCRPCSRMRLPHRPLRPRTR